MKKTQEILGLPIISISDGLEVGRVKSVIINAEKGLIEYIVVDNGIQILSARVIPTDSILGIGEYAVTIENDSSINDINKIPAAIDLLQKNIQVKGTKVLTKKGRLIGEIGDIYVDENECCKIAGLEYIADITQKRIRLIPRESVITFGKNLIVVIEEVESTLVDSSSQLGFKENQTEDEKKNLETFETVEKIDVSNTEPVADLKEAEAYEDNISEDLKADEAFDFINTADSAIDKDEVFETGNEADDANSTDAFELSINDTFEINNENETVVLSNEESEYIEGDGYEVGDNSSAPEASSEVNAAGLFEQRQKQYLNGRKATKTISDSNGNIIVSEGMVINSDIIDIAKNAGKLIELVMNNRA